MNLKREENLYETISDIIGDVILIEAMTLRMEQRRPYMVNASPELMEQTFHRVMCYLSQHAADLQVLTKRTDT